MHEEVYIKCFCIDWKVHPSGLMQPMPSGWICLFIPGTHEIYIYVTQHETFGPNDQMTILSKKTSK